MQSSIVETLKEFHESGVDPWDGLFGSAQINLKFEDSQDVCKQISSADINIFSEKMSQYLNTHKSESTTEHCVKSTLNERNWINPNSSSISKQIVPKNRYPPFKAYLHHHIQPPPDISVDDDDDDENSMKEEHGEIIGPDQAKVWINRIGLLEKSSGNTFDINPEDAPKRKRRRIDNSQLRKSETTKEIKSK
ncbi:MAG: hypothetical protein EZS28_002123 [Streblomastix strix]|uniref:Uncharacterized protein n=1 Tax=Streblomastix strix TaxID=222440 RepID=A0A5J4X672_9EUKA|nr:MAG: hypothetical protein EZS28_002123 [Streblomastix strix]